jgi:hypothetical protein
MLPCKVSCQCQNVFLMFLNDHEGQEKMKQHWSEGKR